MGHHCGGQEEDGEELHGGASSLPQICGERENYYLKMMMMIK